MLQTMPKAVLSPMLSLVFIEIKSPFMKMDVNDATGIGIILNLKTEMKYIKRVKPCGVGGVAVG